MYATSNKTRKDYLRDIAERASLFEENNAETNPNGANKRVAPTDPQELDRLERAFAEGLAEFCDEGDWKFLQPEYSFLLVPAGTGPLNIEGDASRYRLPRGTQFVREDVFWKLGTSGGGRVTKINRNLMRERRHLSPTDVGQPRECAISMGMAQDSATTSTRRAGQPVPMELVIHPSPDQAYTVNLVLDYRLMVPLSDGDTGMWPAYHDLTIIAYGARSLLRQGRAADDPALIRAENEASKRLAKSRENDSKLRDASLGGPIDDGGPRGRTVTLHDHDGALLASDTVTN